MWNIFGRYKGGKVLPSARQMNLIAAILNHITQGTGIHLECPQLPSTDAPFVISVDTDWLSEFVGGGGGAGTVKSVDGHSPDSNGAVSFGLTGGRIVMTDSSGNLSVVSTAPVASASITVVTSVDWDSANHRLTKKTRTLTFTNGVLTNAGSESAASVIDTATIIKWS